MCVKYGVVKLEYLAFYSEINITVHNYYSKFDR